jgi:hypothetical protein
MTGGFKTNGDGEVIPYTRAEALVLCRQYRAVAEALREAREEVKRLERDQHRLHGQVVAALGVGGAMPVSSEFAVVVEPGQAGRRSVSRVAAERYREQLLALNLGLVVEEYHPPTLNDVNKHRALVIAAGVQIQELVPDSAPGRPRVTVVDKRDGA